jgi:hypothetical protein
MYQFLNITRVTAVLVILLMTGRSTTAQTGELGGYYPIDHSVPGRAAQWARTIHPPCQEYTQPVRIELPSRGLVTYFNGSPEAAILTQSPSQAGMLVGQTYRVRISGMPEFPGAELFPSIELIDRLHPPGGREQEFPIPVQFTEAEIATALDDQLVTKIVYLEQPQFAHPKPVDAPLNVVDLPAASNLLLAAEQRGRVMAIIRIGGRVPSLQDPEDHHFFGNAPVMPEANVGEPRTMSHFAGAVSFGPLAAE